jgi:hypothetical protein
VISRSCALFATPGRRPEPAGFATVSTTVQQTGAPIIDGCLSWFDCTLEDILPGGDHEILVGRVAAAGGHTGEPLVYWAGEYRALTADDLRPELVEGGALSLSKGRASTGAVLSSKGSARISDQVANASDGLAVAYHVLDIGPAEMLDAQHSIEPAITALAAHAPQPTSGTGSWNLSINRSWSSMNRTSSTGLRWRFTTRSQPQRGTGCCKPRSGALSRCNPFTTATAAVPNQLGRPSPRTGGCLPCCAAGTLKRPVMKCARIWMLYAGSFRSDKRPLNGQH